MAALTISEQEEKKLKGRGFLNNKHTDNFSARIVTKNGRISAEQLKCIANAAEKYGSGNVLLTTRQTFEVPGIPVENLDAFAEAIEACGLIVGGTGPKVRPIVSCKGTTCRYGLHDTFALADELQQKYLYGYRDITLPHKFKIAVGGCPNNCVKPELNDIGIIGQCIPNFDEASCHGCKKCAVAAECPVHAATVSDGKCHIDPSVCIHCGRCVGKCYFNLIPDGAYGYKIYIGGRWGKNTRVGQPLSKVFSSKDEMMDTVDRVFQFYRSNAQPGERFASTVDRLGFENVEKAVLNLDNSAKTE